jgi:hypothetical protein
MSGTEREKSLFSIKLVSKYGYHFQKLSCVDAVVRWIGCAHWGYTKKSSSIFLDRPGTKDLSQNADALYAFRYRLPVSRTVLGVPVAGDLPCVLILLPCSRSAAINDSYENYPAHQQIDER